MVYCRTVILALCILVKDQTIHCKSENGLSAHPGHLKAFGSVGPFLPAVELDKFPEPEDFFVNYVKKEVPFVVRGGAQIMAAYSKWTDDYLKGIDEDVVVELSNDEKGDHKTTKMPLSTFMTSFKGSNMYLITPIPESLKQDVTVPCSIQCDEVLQEMMAEDVMWLSDTEAKSAVHTDPAENINCVLRGKKTFILVNSTKHRDKVKTNVWIDIDAADYIEQPWLADIEYYKVDVNAGDCVYIPYMWHHQVRSYGTSMAVNVWWKHYLKTPIDYNRCSVPCDHKRTMTECQYIGIVQLEQQPDETRDFLLSMFDGRLHDAIDVNEFREIIYSGPLSGAFSQLKDLVDVNGDGFISEDDIRNIPQEELQKVSEFFQASSKYADHGEL